MPFPHLSKKEGLILRLLVEHDTLYGLQLVKLSNDRLKRGTVYVTLGRMEEKSLVVSRAEDRIDERIGLPRRLYSATQLGKVTLEALETAARSVNDSGEPQT